MTARGLRLRNPFLIRKTSIEWRGEIESADDEFESFRTDLEGIRAGMRNMVTHQMRDGLRTIRTIITKHAPPKGNTGKVENDTEAYINSVCKRGHFQPDEFINLRDVNTLVRLADAVIRHENGTQPYPLDMLQHAARMALNLPEKREEVMV